MFDLYGRKIILCRSIRYGLDYYLAVLREMPFSLNFLVSHPSKWRSVHYDRQLSPNGNG